MTVYIFLIVFFLVSVFVNVQICLGIKSFYMSEAHICKMLRCTDSLIDIPMPAAETVTDVFISHIVQG